MFENPRRGRQARNFTTNVPKILVLKSSSEQIFSRKLQLGAPVLKMTSAQFVETSKSPTTVLLRTTLARTIILYELLILLGSNHLQCTSYVVKVLSSSPSGTDNTSFKIIWLKLSKMISECY